MTPATELSTADWLVAEHGIEPKLMGARETRLTVGNGYLATRGSLVESRRGAWPATYVAGVFDRRDATVIDLVRAPDWLATRIDVAGRVLDVDSCSVLSHTQTLDLRQALLFRTTDFEDPDGRQTRLTTVRFASGDNSHLVATRLQIMPLNHGAPITVETGFNGHSPSLDRCPYADLDRFDEAERWEKWTKTKHTHHVQADATGGSALLEVATFDRDIRIGYAMELTAPEADVTSRGVSGHEHTAAIVHFDARQGATYTLDKLVGICTSRDYRADGGAVLQRSAAVAAEARSAGFDAALAAHRREWARRWKACDCVIGGDQEATRAIRFNLYHLLIASNPADPTVSIGAKALAGEGYKGHVFWDTEIFVLPFFIYTQPDTARALLRYRYETLEGARGNARDNGYEGAQFAWESADSGAETTPKWTHDGVNRIWTGEEEIHITADIVYAMDTYVQATGDAVLMSDYGAVIAIEGARFWTSRLEYDTEHDRYDLTNVIGPDEFHEHVDNNLYTNALAQWALRRAAQLADDLRTDSPDVWRTIAGRLELTADEVSNWRRVADRVRVPAFGGKDVLEQFEGYAALDDIPIVEWDHNNMPVYPAGYDHFNCGETTLIKQPDVLMLMYLLPDLFDPETVCANFDFYEARTMHKSSLSPAIHAIMGIEAGATDKAVQYFRRSVLVDLVDNQGNTRDGIHIASASGSWMSVVAGFGGFRVRDGRPAFDPWLPPEWTSVQFNLSWHGSLLGVRVSHDGITLDWPASARPLTVAVAGRNHRLQPGETPTLPYDPRR